MTKPSAWRVVASETLHDGAVFQVDRDLAVRGDGAGPHPVAADGHEQTQVVLVSPADLERLVASGEIDHALGIAALSWNARADRNSRPGGGRDRYPRP
jgi:hypothetical protein